jgi:hypothetical protein
VPFLLRIRYELALGATVIPSSTEANARDQHDGCESSRLHGDLHFASDDVR